MNNSTSAIGTANADTYLKDYDAITEVMARFSDGVRTGNSALMKPTVHPNAGFFDYHDGKLLAGSIQMLSDWVDANGPSRDYRDAIASFDIYETIAVVRLDLNNLKGKFVGEQGSRLSDLVQFIQTDGK